jgi:hypothetical protein
MFLSNRKVRRIPQAKEYAKLVLGLALVLTGVAVFIAGIEIIGIGLGISGFMLMLDTMMLLKIITLDHREPAGKRNLKKELTMIGQ